MNIIILGKAGATSRNIDLSTWRGRALCTGLAIAGVVLFLGCGFAVGRVSVDTEGRMLGEIRDLRQTILVQREALDEVARDSGRDLDALALQLGQLQAQATRLNALGERLTQVGKLDDGEFDFAAAPALGGPEEAPLVAGAAMPITAGIDTLRAEFERQEAQLGMIENMLLDRKIDNALLPTGWPVGGGYIVSGFGVRTDPITGHRASHLGIDFDVPYGSDVMAVAEGVVTYSGQRSGYGNVVEIDHGNGYMTRYAHNSQNMVELGTRVHIGDVVAKVGSTGRSTGPHCHFEVWLNGRPVNPAVYVRSSRASRV
ncbi:M23 family metallopeptidase [Dokdonella koreensis]|uniref:Exported peptidase-like enzyme n=1 Tax=Dokdonella koreensis DS-123 TaxID=1300342 RepID=A0A167GIK2_9GAMM|nr:M23 family metallopeptidase [Dokdonella koreensis]ANB16598.1 Exported peptidase-like enzyme [Dokdonella koreensis DS-123]